MEILSKIKEALKMAKKTVDAVPDAGIPKVEQNTALIAIETLEKRAIDAEEQLMAATLHLRRITAVLHGRCPPDRLNDLAEAEEFLNK